MASSAQREGTAAARSNASGSRTASNGALGDSGMLGSRKEEGFGVLNMQAVTDLDRQIVLVHGNQGKEDAEEDEEYAFEDDEEATQMPPRWLAIARYYSGKAFSTWAMFSELSTMWGKKEPIPVRELGDNRFLVEFDSEKLWRRVLEGGPWKHKKDAVIFAPYNGTQRMSEVVIDSIALWVRIYDIPVSMITDGFARALGSKLGKVIAVGRAVQNYKRVKVDFPLAKPIMYSIEQKVKGTGVMVFMVKYENIPHFCFGCGRIGHAQEECPDEERVAGGVRFGKALRCSPQKMGTGRSMTIPAEDAGARRALNFSGDQQRRMMAAAFSSNSRRGEGSTSNRRMFVEEEDLVLSPEKGKVDSVVPEEIVDGVKNMAVDPIIPDLNAKPAEPVTGKVSGLDSYVGSSGTSESGATDHPSMLERSATGKASKSSLAGDKRSPLGVRGAAKDLEKPKRNKKAGHIAATIQELAEAGLIPDGLQIKKENVLTEERAGRTCGKPGESPASCSERTPSHATPLTGAHEEPRQEQ